MFMKRMTRMRAVVLDRYGPPEVLRVGDVERPVPARGEVLVRIHAATVNRNDCAWRRGSPFVQRAVSGWRRPRAEIPGNEFSGTVIEIGTEVSRFAVGDEVFGVRAYLSEGFGAQAEYLAVAATSAMARKPPEAGGLLNFAMVPLTARSRGRRAIFAAPAFSRPNVELLADLMASGEYRPVVDRTYPLDEVVEANRYVESERKTGNVVLTLGGRVHSAP